MSPVKRSKPIRHYRALQAIREQRRLRLDAVEKYVGIAQGRLSDFENGIREPSRKQLEHLAKAYNVALYRMIGDGIPNLPDTPRDYRRRDLKPAELSPRGLRSIFSMERISKFVGQLLGEVKTDFSRFNLSFIEEQDPIRRGAEARDFFDDWYRDRRVALDLSGSIVHRFTMAFRLFIEVQGSVVSINDAPENDYLGFFLTSERNIKSIFVNREISSKKAQLFTLIHEYAHFLNAAPGVSNPFVVSNDLERSCNRFAAEFLAPTKQFSELAGTYFKLANVSIFDYVNKISNESLLSRHATAIRLVENGYLSEKQLRVWEGSAKLKPKEEKDQEKAEAPEINGGIPHAKRTGELGYVPTYIAALAVRARVIDSYDVQRGIGLAEKTQAKAFDLALRKMEAAR